MIENGTICPKCTNKTMPPLRPGSTANARQCQNTACRYVEETVPYDPVARTWHGVTAEPIKKFRPIRQPDTHDAPFNSETGTFEVPDFDATIPVAPKSIP